MQKHSVWLCFEDLFESDMKSYQKLGAIPEKWFSILFSSIENSNFFHRNYMWKMSISDIVNLIAYHLFISNKVTYNLVKFRCYQNIVGRICLHTHTHFRINEKKTPILGVNANIFCVVKQMIYTLKSRFTIQLSLAMTPFCRTHSHTHQHIHTFVYLFAKN